MIIYLNCEKAQNVFDSHDPFAATVARRINSFMISDEMRFANPFRPKKPFDMCYFYHSLVRTLGTLFDRKVHTGLEADYKMVIFNQPDLRQEAWKDFDFVKLGVASRYICQVEFDSDVGGAEFDLGFACAVACRSLNAQVISDLKSIPLDAEEPDGDDWDRWLAGFNTR